MFMIVGFTVSGGGAEIYWNMRVYHLEWIDIIYDILMYTILFTIII